MLTITSSIAIHDSPEVQPPLSTGILGLMQYLPDFMVALYISCKVAVPKDQTIYVPGKRIVRAVR